MDVNPSDSLEIGPLYADAEITLVAYGSDGSQATETVYVTISAPSAPTIQASVSPTSVPSGGIATLTWDTTNVTSVTIDGGLGAVAQNLSGSLVVGPLYTTATLTIVATGPGGTTTKTLTVIVQQAAPAVTLTATPNPVGSGGTVLVSWTTAGATSVTLNSGGGALNVPLNGSSQAGPLSTPTTFVLTAVGPGGTTTKYVTVSIQTPSGQIPTIGDFSADNQEFDNGTGGPVTLSWAVLGATSVSIDQGVGQVNEESGSQVVNVTQTTTFTLTATNAYGSSTSEITILVNEPAEGGPVINSFAADETAVGYGGTTSISWNTTNATSVTLDAGLGPVEQDLSGSLEVGPLYTNATIKLTATNDQGSVSQSISISVSTTPATTSSSTSWLIAGAAAVGILALVMLGRKK
jgi:hypothetical protein